MHGMPLNQVQGTQDAFKVGRTSFGLHQLFAGKEGARDLDP